MTKTGLRIIAQNIAITSFKIFLAFTVELQRLHIPKKIDIFFFFFFFFFFIEERFNKLIHSINTIIKCGILQPVNSLLFLNWVKNEMIFIVSLN